MLGSGIFSVPGVVLNSVGSVGLFLIAWILAPLFAYGLSCYVIEFNLLMRPYSWVIPIH